MTKVKTNLSIPQGLLITFIITISVIGIVVFIVFLQHDYFYKINSITIESQTGPISPEFQKKEKLTLTPTSCTYIVEKIQPQSTTTTYCPMNQETFQKVVDSLNKFRIIEKIQITQDLQQQTLVGAKRTSITVGFQNRTSLTSQINPQLKADFDPFFSDLQLVVPQSRSLQFDL